MTEHTPTGASTAAPSTADAIHKDNAPATMTRGRYALLLLGALALFAVTLAGSGYVLRAGSAEVARRHDRYIAPGSASHLVEQVLAPRQQIPDAQVQMQHNDPRQMEWIGPYASVKDAATDFTPLRDGRLVDVAVLCRLDDALADVSRQCASGALPRASLCLLDGSRPRADLKLQTCAESGTTQRYLMVLLGSQSRLIQSERLKACQAQLCRALER